MPPEKALDDIGHRAAPAPDRTAAAAVRCAACARRTARGRAPRESPCSRARSVPGRDWSPGTRCQNAAAPHACERVRYPDHPSSTVPALGLSSVVRRTGEWWSSCRQRIWTQKCKNLSTARGDLEADIIDREHRPKAARESASDGSWGLRRAVLHRATIYAGPPWRRLLTAFVASIPPAARPIAATCQLFFELFGAMSHDWRNRLRAHM